LNSPYITIYANTEGLFSEIDDFIQKKNGLICRLGTGELTDSLALDPFTRQSESLIPFFSQKDDALFELKTKSAFVDHLIDLPHGTRTVISWSLNTERLIHMEEKDAAPLDERLAAAARCQKAGYPIGLHFDPMIFYTGWEEDYQQLVTKIFHFIDPRGVIWISLGSLRYPPSLKTVIEKRWPDSSIFLGESFPGLDGKIRYLKALRIEMYRLMVVSLRNHNSDFFIYLCMETKEVWKRVFGWSPSSNRELERAFDRDIRTFLKGWARCCDLG
jgi:spore photoproduct lyase